MPSFDLADRVAIVTGGSQGLGRAMAVALAQAGDELLQAAQELARELADGPTLAIRWTKASVNKLIRERMNLILDYSLNVENMTMATADHKEAAAAFVERRRPVFSGT